MKLSEVYPVNEYGMSSAGSPTPVSNQTMGANARATAQQRTQAPVQSASPTTQPAAQRATSQQAQATVVKASDLSNGDQMVGPEDTELTVISAAGTTSNEVPNDSPNSVVVQDADGNLYAVEPDTEIAAAEPQNESVFVRMARLPVLEQLAILAKLDNDAINRVWNGISIISEHSKPYFLKPGQLRGSWKDTELRKLGFRQAKNGSWFTNQARWNKLSQMGERHWRKLLENTMPSSTVQEGVPNNDAAAVLKRLMSQPLLTGDIRAQMDAYIAIPDPNMITHFRKIRGEQGDNVDLRNTLRDYAQRLHPTVQRQAGL